MEIIYGHNLSTRIGLICRAFPLQISGGPLTKLLLGFEHRRDAFQKQLYGIVTSKNNICAQTPSPKAYLPCEHIFLSTLDIMTKCVCVFANQRGHLYGQSLQLLWAKVQLLGCITLELYNIISCHHPMLHI